MRLSIITADALLRGYTINKSLKLNRENVQPHDVTPRTDNGLIDGHRLEADV